MGAHVAGGGNHHGDNHDDRDNGAVDINHGDSQTKLIAQEPCPGSGCRSVPPCGK